MKKLLLIVLLFCCHKVVVGQTFTIYGDKCYGGTDGERLGRLIMTSDFRFIAITGTSSNSSGDITSIGCDTGAVSDLWTIGIDSSWNLLWQNRIDGNKPDYTPRILLLNNSQIGFSCNTISDSLCDKSEPSRGMNDYWMGVCDTTGTLIWERTFGGNSTDWEPGLLQASTGDLYIFGSSVSGISGDKSQPHYGSAYDFWIVKSDSTGAKKWDKIFGGDGAETAGVAHYPKLIEASDGNLLLTGSSHSQISGNVTDSSNGQSDIWIAKMDTSGSVLFDRMYGGTDQEQSNEVIETFDHGFLVCAHTRSNVGFDITEPKKGAVDIWLLRLDSLGNKVWDRRYGGTLSTFATCIKQLPNGNFWVGGYTDSDSLFDISQPGYGQYDYWIMLIDSLGNKLWDKRFGGPGHDRLTNFILLPDSSIILCGEGYHGQSPVKTSIGNGDADLWLLRFKYTDTSTGINEPPGPSTFTIYPNPSTGSITLPENLLRSQLQVFDISGRVVFSQPSIESQEIDLGYLPCGSYLLRCLTDRGMFQSKWVKMNR